MKHSIKFISTLLLFGLPLTAKAACDRYANASNNVTFADTITVPDSLPNGSLITSRPFGGGFPIVHMNCNSPTPFVVSGRYTTPISLPGLNGVYVTNVPGIGMRISAQLQSGLPHVVGLDSASGVLPTGPRIHNYISMRAELYKTAPVVGGTIPSGTLSDSKWAGNRNHLITLNNSIRFVNPAATCDLAAGDVNRSITLPAVQIRAFNNAISAGSRDFELTAECNKASSVTFRFSGLPAAADDWRFANTGTAQGIGLWLYSRIGGVNQTLRANGTDSARTVTVSGNRAILPLGAAYFKNGTVTQGTLVSTATVNITYN